MSKNPPTGKRPCGTKQQITLNDAVRWPTPTNSTMTMGDLEQAKFSGSDPRRPSYAEANRTWPTPKSSPSGPDYARANRAGSGGDDLATAIAKVPTPSANDWKGSSKPGQRRGQLTDPAMNVIPPGGSLNPTWVELLMGWPTNWTSLNPINHIEYIFWLMGCTHGSANRETQILRVLRQGNVTEEIQRTIGRPFSIYQATVLLSDLCEYQNRFDEARLLMACSETLKKEVRSVRISEKTSSASYRSGSFKQWAEEHTDALQALSRLLAYHGEESWKNGSWENATPRVVTGVSSRVDRLKALGNGQVPAVVRAAWHLLMDD